jgi:hypothetical protein
MKKSLALNREVGRLKCLARSALRHVQPNLRDPWLHIFFKNDALPFETDGLGIG